LGSTGFGGGKALATTGGSLGTGWNKEQPLRASAPRPTAKATVLQDTVMNRRVIRSIYNKVGRSGN
jgi:hypothetical protein